MDNLACREELEKILLPHTLQATFPTSKRPRSPQPPPFSLNSTPVRSPCSSASIAGQALSIAQN